MAQVKASPADVVANMYDSKLKQRIPWHSDGRPLFGEEAVNPRECEAAGVRGMLPLNLGDLMVTTGTAQEHLQHKTLANHQTTREKLDALLRDVPAAGREESAEIATPPAQSMAVGSAEGSDMSKKK